MISIRIQFHGFMLTYLCCIEFKHLRLYAYAPEDTDMLSWEQKTY